MKKKLLKDLRGKGVEAFEKALSEKRNVFRAFTFGVAGSKAKNNREGTALRKDIAQILTLLGEKGRTN